jgi:hypothetical protein
VFQSSSWILSLPKHFFNLFRASGSKPSFEFAHGAIWVAFDFEDPSAGDSRPILWTIDDIPTMLFHQGGVVGGDGHIDRSGTSGISNSASSQWRWWGRHTSCGGVDHVGALVPIVVVCGWCTRPRAWSPLALNGRYRAPFLDRVGKRLSHAPSS